jgi:hypothetical protein
VCILISMRGMGSIRRLLVLDGPVGSASIPIDRVIAADPGEDKVSGRNGIPLAVKQPASSGYAHVSEVR